MLRIWVLINVDDFYNSKLIEIKVLSKPRGTLIPFRSLE